MQVIEFSFHKNTAGFINVTFLSIFPLRNKNTVKTHFPAP